MWKKPPYETVVKGTMKDGSIVFFQRLRNIQCNYPSTRVKLIDVYLNETPDCTFKYKNVKKWQLLSTKELYDEYHKYMTDYFSNNPFLPRSNATEIEKAFVEWENSHIEFLLTWCDHYGYDSCDVENPEYFFQKMFEVGWKTHEQLTKKDS